MHNNIVKNLTCEYQVQINITKELGNVGEVV